MIDSIGSLINNISSSAVVAIMFVAVVFLFAINFWQSLQKITQTLLNKIKLPETKSKTRLAPMSPKQVEELSNSLVGKFMTEDLVDGKEVVAAKGTLISEHLAFEAEKRGLLTRLAEISAFWPPES